MTKLDKFDINRKVSLATSDQLKSYLLDSSCILSEGFFISSILLSFTELNPSIIGGLVGASLVSVSHSLLDAIRKSIKFGINYKSELLKNTDEYERCLYSYKEYISKVAKLIKSMDIDSSLDVAMIYMDLLYNGDLSLNGNFEYHKYSKDYDYCQDLWGARVVSGYGVCRHIASSLVDVYKELGYTACYLSVRACENKFKSIISSKINPQPANHAVVVVYGNKGKYIVDPTKRAIYQFLEDNDFAKCVYGNGIGNLVRINYNEYVDRNRRFSFEDYSSMRCSKNVLFTRRYLEEVCRRTNNSYLKNKYLLFEFRKYLAYSFEEIVNLERKISGYRDILPEYDNVKTITKKR